MKIGLWLMGERRDKTWHQGLGHEQLGGWWCSSWDRRQLMWQGEENKDLGLKQFEMFTWETSTLTPEVWNLEKWKLENQEGWGKAE